MIVQISNGLKGYHSIINYHDNKVQEGKAESILSSIGYTKKEDVINYFLQNSKKNTSVKNKGHDIPFSFNHQDQITDDKFKEIANDYLKEMGFEGHPFIVYKHNDKEHQHYHVVVSNIDNTGKYNDKMRYFYKKDSQRISRELEVKHDLVITEYNRKEKSESLRLVNAQKYSMQKAIKKAMLDETIKPLIFEHIKDIQPLIEKEDLNNEHLEALLGSSFTPLKEVLEESGTLKKSLKSELIHVLDHALDKSKSPKEFEELGKNSGLYVRYLKSKNEYMYGITDKSNEKQVYYFSEKKLPERFSALSVNGFTSEKVVSDKQQKKYINTILNKALKQSVSQEELYSYLKKRNIETVFHSNSGGTYGVSFTPLNVKDAATFKASEIARGLSWKNIEKQLQENMSSYQKTNKEYHFSSDNTNKNSNSEQRQSGDFIAPVEKHDYNRNKHEDEELHRDKKKSKNLKR